MCCSQPDTSGINRAAEANADIARDALAWYRQAYADQAPARAAGLLRAFVEGGMIAGFGVDSYVLALEAMVSRLRAAK